MKITKFNQSCLLVETNNKRFLIDPGNIGYDEYLLNEWKDIDYILITHRHGDHCNVEAINTIAKRDNAKIYTTKEVADNTSLINPIIVKQGDIIKTLSVNKGTPNSVDVVLENNSGVVIKKGNNSEIGERAYCFLWKGLWKAVLTFWKLKWLRKPVQ